MIRVTIYNEGLHEKSSEKVAAVYPNGIHNAIADFLRCDDIEVKTVTLETVEELTEEALKATDVLMWWGHMAHNKVPDEIAMRVRNEVLKGMGFIALHSAHHSKPFKLLMGTTCNLGWRENGDLERIWNINPAHPITQGIGRYFELPHVETYAEPFGIPTPDEILFIGWFSGGEVLRSGLTYKRNNGKIFYFQPGHETFPTYYNKDIQKVIINAVRWAAPEIRTEKIEFPRIPVTNQF